jgi:TRAP-type C4-dicarboxylate transport system substrate-binding protein
MKVTNRASATARICGFALAVLLATPLAVQAADGKTYVMKIGLATLGDALHQYANDFAAAVEKDSGGRIKVEVYPASRLGPIQQQAESVQFGAIQCQIVPPEFLAGIDERFEVLTTPALVTSMATGQRLAADPAVQKLMLGLGADKGLHGAALIMIAQSAVIARKPIRHLADFKGKKIRVLASQFQRVAMQRLGATPKPMTLGEVLPALQDNAVDGALSSVAVFASMNFRQAAQYVTETGQPAIFGIVEVSRRWFESLPAELREVIDKAASRVATAAGPAIIESNEQARRAWREAGGELISLPADEQDSLLKIVAGVGDEVANAKPPLAAAYKIVTDAAQRVH